MYTTKPKLRLRQKYTPGQSSWKIWIQPSNLQKQLKYQFQIILKNQTKAIFRLELVILYLKTKTFILIKGDVFRMVVIGTVKTDDALLRFVYRNHMLKEMDNDRAFNPFVSRCNTRTNVLSIQESINYSIPSGRASWSELICNILKLKTEKKTLWKKTVYNGYYYFILKNIYTIGKTF